MSRNFQLLIQVVSYPMLLLSLIVFFSGAFCCIKQNYLTSTDTLRPMEPNGDMLATSWFDAAARVTDLRTGKLVHIEKVYGRCKLNIAFWIFLMRAFVYSPYDIRLFYEKVLILVKTEEQKTITINFDFNRSTILPKWSEMSEEEICILSLMLN